MLKRFRISAMKNKTLRSLSLIGATGLLAVSLAACSSVNSDLNKLPAVVKQVKQRINQAISQATSTVWVAPKCTNTAPGTYTFGGSTFPDITCTPQAAPWLAAAKNFSIVYNQWLEHPLTTTMTETQVGAQLSADLRAAGGLTSAQCGSPQAGAPLSASCITGFNILDPSNSMTLANWIRPYLNQPVMNQLHQMFAEPGEPAHPLYMMESQIARLVIMGEPANGVFSMSMTTPPVVTQMWNVGQPYPTYKAFQVNSGPSGTLDLPMNLSANIPATMAAASHAAEIWACVDYNVIGISASILSTTAPGDVSIVAHSGLHVQYIGEQQIGSHIAIGGSGNTFLTNSQESQYCAGFDQ